MSKSNNRLLQLGHSLMSRVPIFLIVCGVTLTLATCGMGQVLPTETPERLEATRELTLVPEPSPTDVLPKVLYYHSSDSSELYVQNILAALQDLTRDSGMELVEIGTKPDAAELAEYQVVVLFSAEAELLNSLPSLSQTIFVVINPELVTEGIQAWTIGDLTEAREQAAFLAGYIAVLLTPDWRAGAIGLLPTEGEANLLEAFVQGGQFFCGLCRPAFPPYYDYPVPITIPSNEVEPIKLGLSEAETKGLRMLLLDEGAAEITGSISTASNFQFLGLQSPPENLRSEWIVTLRPAPEQALVENWTLILSGSPVQSIGIPIQIEDKNTTLLTPGKLLLVQQIRDDLVAGFIQPIGIK